MGQVPGSSPRSNPISTSPAANPDKDHNLEPLSCPVDHKSREVWLRKAGQQKDGPTSDTAPTPDRYTQRSPFSFLWSSSSPSKSAQPPSPPQPKITNSRLRADRQVSSIPRGYEPSSNSSARASQTTKSVTSSDAPSSESAIPSVASPNNQTSDPHTSASGNWIYPSEEMFFNAMRRKSYSPRAEDMSSVIPIHNAVNEKTWQDILAWEKGIPVSSNELCDGPKLVSFSGDSKKLTPRARWNTLRGYEKPFDRHDWVIDRCGKKVEYVIDFYAGKRKEGDKLGPSFFLDVRPKLNSWEGCKMRALRAIGWWNR